MSEQLRHQIYQGFGRVVRRYAILSGSLLVLLFAGFLLYATQKNLMAQSDLVRTRLNSEITSTLNQADTLIHSPILWTGLMDSFSHETTLKPLFKQLNRMEDKRFVLLDYQGRVSIEAPDVSTEALQEVRQTIPKIEPTGLSVQMLRTQSSEDLLLTLMPIMSPLADAPLGYLMTEFSVSASVKKLRADSLMDFAFNLKPDFPPAGWLTMSAVYEDEIVIGQNSFSYDTRYAISLIPDIVALASLIMVIIALGYTFLFRTDKWLNTFAGQLTAQLDQVVSYARSIFGTRQPEEIAKIDRGSDGVATVMQTLESLLKEQAIAQENLRKIAFEDALTGLPVYALFRESLDKQLAHQAAAGKSLTLLAIDVNKLKHINDVYGFAVGDKIIQKASQILLQCLPEPRMISRRSGDEFVAWLTTEPAQLQDIIESATHFDVIEEGDRIPVTLTIGAASYPDDAQTTKDLVFCSEYAIKEAKKRTRQSFVMFDHDLGLQVLRNKQIEERLGLAIQNSQIIPFYQPEVDMVSGEITGVEALARWHDPELGWIAPNEFLPIVEHLRISTDLSHCILNQVFQDAPIIWQHFPGIKIAFNLSPQDFHGSHLSQLIDDCATQRPNGLHGFEIELTEEDIVDLDFDMQTKLNQLIDAGIRIAIDDFGTRYSSLARLASLPLHRLKIDFAFVSNINEKKGEEIIRLIIGLAKALNLDITTEGVERIEQRDLLIQLGCVHGQGWLYQKALPLADLLVQPKNLTPKVLQS